MSNEHRPETQTRQDEQARYCSIRGRVDDLELGDEASLVSGNPVMRKAQYLPERRKVMRRGALSTLSQQVTSFEATTGDQLAALEAENRALRALMRVAQATAGVSDLDDLLDLIRSETEVALEAERCSVFLLDREAGELWSRVASGFDDHTRLRFPADTGIAGAVAQTGEVMNIPDVYEDKRFNPAIDQKTGFRTRSMLCVPMRNRKLEMIGVFQIINKRQGTFTASDEELLSAIAANAAIAIENARLITDQKIAFDSFIRTLSSTIDARDPITAGHSERVSAYTLLIGDQMGLSDDEQEALKYASLLHDIGKIGIREEVLVKDGRLTRREYEHIQQHVRYTEQILNNIHFECHLQSVPAIAGSHHERMDGTGYHKGLKGQEIPLGGRILAIGDVFDAITSRRQYRNRMPFGRVLGLLRRNAGDHFDPECVDAFFKIPLVYISEVLLAELSRTADAAGFSAEHAHEQLAMLHKLATFGTTLGELEGAMRKDKPKKAERELITVFDAFYRSSRTNAPTSCDHD